MLSIQNLTYRIAGRTLLDNVSVNIPAGHRVASCGMTKREIYITVEALFEMMAFRSIS